MSKQACNIPDDLIAEMCQLIVDHDRASALMHAWVIEYCNDNNINIQPDSDGDRPTIYYTLSSYWYKQLMEQTTVQL